MYKLLQFTIRGNEDGSLVALEEYDTCIPFSIKRVYYIWGTTPHFIRGKHAHKNLEQMIICVSGSCDFFIDDGIKRTCIHLNQPNVGLYINGLVWREFTNFSQDCVLVVLASAIYEEEDYIRDYNNFLQLVEKEKNRSIPQIR